MAGDASRARHGWVGYTAWLSLGALGVVGDIGTFFLGKESVVVAAGAGLRHWRERLYAVMHRNASSAARHFRLPLDQVIEVGTPVELSRCLR